MIPQVPGKILKHTDEDSGIVFHLAYLTGDKQDEFMRLQGQDVPVTQAHVDQATKLVEKENPGRKWKKREKEKTIRVRAAVLAGEKMAEESSTEKLKSMRDLINLIVVGWEIPKEKKGQWPEFPKDGKPGDMFRLNDAVRLTDMISEYLDELSGPTPEEQKN